MVGVSSFVGNREIEDDGWCLTREGQGIVSDLRLVEGECTVFDHGR